MSSELLALGLGCLTMGLVLLVVGGVMVLGLRATRDVARRLRTATPLSIAQASGDEALEVRGRVLASGQGELVSPLTGRLGVLLRIDATYWEPTSNSFRTFYVHKESREFLIEDGSGARARVVYGAHGNIMLSTQRRTRYPWRRHRAFIPFAINAAMVCGAG